MNQVSIRILIVGIAEFLVGLARFGASGTPFTGTANKKDQQGRKKSNFGFHNRILIQKKDIQYRAN